MLVIRYMNKLLFKFLLIIIKRKLSEGKNIEFISLWASSFSISLFFSVNDVNIALLGNPFSKPMSIMLAPFPLILKSGLLINCSK